jgi:hypothetical protein
MVRLLIFGLLLGACSGQAFAGIEVLRDSIGVDSTLTDELPGGSTAHFGGADWSSPGLVRETTNKGLLSEARFVIFAKNSTQDPENTLADISTYYMEFHLWTDGVLGGTDSFDQNPRGHSVGGHVIVDANTPLQSLIDVQPWGHTGPADFPFQFNTFLVTVDLSSANVEVQAGQQYVMSLLKKGTNFGTITDGPPLGGSFRISGSTATGPYEDLFRNNSSTLFPGYVDSQLGFPFKQYAGALELENGDHDANNVVDGLDFLKWQRGESPQPLSSFDLAAWELNYGETLVSPVAASAVIPEPSSLLLAGLAGLFFGTHRRRV